MRATRWAPLDLAGQGSTVSVYSVSVCVSFCESGGGKLRVHRNREGCCPAVTSTHSCLSKSAHLLS